MEEFNLSLNDPANFPDTGLQEFFYISYTTCPGFKCNPVPTTVPDAGITFASIVPGDLAVSTRNWLLLSLSESEFIILNIRILIQPENKNASSLIQISIVLSPFNYSYF